MEIGPVINLAKETRQRQKRWKMTPCQQIKTSLLIFQFMANLKQSGSRIPDAWSVKLTFSLIVIFYLTKTENRNKKPLTQLSYYCFQ